MSDWTNDDIAGLRGNTGMFEPGECLGDYEVLEMLGQGGQGETYRVRDVGGLEYVAKIFTGRSASREFEYECAVFRVLRSLPKCDALVFVHPAAKHLSKEVLILEYIEGVTLDTILGDNLLSFRDTLNAVRDILQGLKVMHENQIVHRDVKPSNVKRSDRNYILFDFGIAAKARDLEAPDAGTPGFRPPESEVTPAWDTFSVGVLFYLLTAGRMPLWERGSTCPADEKDNVIMPQELDLHPWAKAFLARALAFNPKDRYADAGAMLDALKWGRCGLLAGASLVSWMQRHRIQAITLGLLLFVAVSLPIAVFSRLEENHRIELERQKDEFEAKIASLHEGKDRLEELLSSVAGDLLNRALKEFEDLLALYSLNLSAGQAICSSFWAHRRDHYKYTTWSEHEINTMLAAVDARRRSIEALRTRAEDSAEGMVVIIDQMKLEAPGASEAEEVWVWLYLEGRTTEGGRAEIPFRLVKKEAGLFTWNEEKAARIEGLSIGTRVTVSVKDGGPSWTERIPRGIRNRTGISGPRSLVSDRVGTLGILQPQGRPWKDGGRIVWPEEGYTLRVEGRFP